ncbi:helix-turn-helix domain-containing protein, partial [Klebsiella quasipneumoniae]|uniref:helix-turn-helix domain-containing protein n=1 Tax=Klebsiella quasipneumoniae TaxID=1463165 RepID=UPI003004372D
ACVLPENPASYRVVRTKSYLFNKAAIRQQITAAAYIKSRTYLSRSGIMRILAELRTGNYITMERGILLDINHLPRKY